MGRAYTDDLRKRVAASVLGGRACRATAALFGVSVASAVKWSQRHRATGSAAARPLGRKQPRSLASEREPGSRSKKDADRARAGPAGDRRASGTMAQGQGRIDPRRLVFIDETWAKTNMARLRGWCARGLPLVDKVPHGHWRTLTFLAALRCDRIDAPLVLDGPINAESFTAWVQQFLLPTLTPGDVVVMDNAAATTAGPCASLSAPPAPGSCSSRPTHPTSTPSSRSSPSSRRCSEKPARAGRGDLAPDRIPPRRLSSKRMRKLPSQQPICFSFDGSDSRAR